VQFELKVLRSNEAVSALTLEAGDAQQAELRAVSLGYEVLSVRAKSGINFPLPSSKTAFSLLLFSQELVALLRAGLSLVEAIETLTEKDHRSESRSVLERIRGRLYEGQSFSSALSEFPDIFPALFVAMVRASEKTGDLTQTLGRYIVYRSQLDQIRKKVITSSIYPILLLVVGALVTLFLLGYVVPKFSSVYENSHADLPWMSQLLMRWGQLLHHHAKMVAVVFIALVITAIYCLSLKSLRGVINHLVWKIPFFGRHMHIYQLARFYRTLGMLLQGGITLVTALQMSSDMLEPSLRRSLLLALEQVKEGQPLSVSLEQQELTTPVSMRMMRVGERSGDMGEMMERAAAFYDEEIARVVDWTTRLFEPILMVIIGLVIGVIVVLMYMPIFELADAIQ
jgi:general secretion pathway protein F